MSDVTKQTWGHELTIARTNDYCTKILAFTGAGSRTDFFFNVKKEKTWFVNTGNFKLRWIDTDTGKLFETVLGEGQTHHVLPLMPCCLEAIVADSSITESSNGDFEKDTFIVLPSNNIG
ncbi:hypothetical protein N9C48_00020 [bacterium]|jgi:hypothetical protein|nr:hypothetical protein [bacterium]MDA9938474.1 hypothetical protein [bacterium]